MRKKNYLTPNSEIRIVELYSLLVQSIEEDNNADAKKNRFFSDEADQRNSLWDDETLE